MGIKRGFYFIIGALGVQWRLNKHIFLWLGVAVFTGMAIAVTVVFNAKFTPSLISNNLLDTNLPRIIRPSVGLGSVVLARTFSFALMFAVIFAVCLTKWTVWLVYVYAAYQGFRVFVSLYWTLTKFAAVTGVILFLIYLVLLIILLLAMLAVTVYCLRVCTPARQAGFRGCIQWNNFWSVCAKYLIFIVAFGFIEWLSYWFVLSKIVFVI